MKRPRNYADLKISAIVPAYNEAKNILQVLGQLRQVNAIQEIIVVSDGSTDGTAELARNFGGVKVIELRQNLGKTKAAIRGVDEAAHPAILFCDADLVNLRKEHLDQLIHRYCEGFDMVIMDKGSQPWVFRSLLQSVPAISGTRIFDREHFYKIPFRKTDRFQFENRINDHFLDNGLAITVSPAEEIHDTRKFIKYPFWKGLFLDLRGGLDVLLANGLLGIFRNLRTFRRIRRLAYTPDETKVPRR